MTTALPIKTAVWLPRITTVLPPSPKPCRNCADCPGKRLTIAQLDEQGLYNGAELRPYEGRPGAMDAFRLPSVRSGKRIFPTIRF